MRIYILMYVAMVIMFLIVTLHCKLNNGLRVVFERRLIGLTWISAIGIGLVFGLRSSSIGGDWVGYLRYYDVIRADTWSEIWINYPKVKYANFELGFVLLCKLISVFTDGYQGIIFISTLLLILPAGAFIAYQSNNRLMSMLIFLAFPHFATLLSAARQGIAIGLLLIAYIFVQKNKPIVFAILVVVASFFHSSVLFCLVLYPVYKINLSKKSLLFGGVGVIGIVYVFRLYIFRVLIRIITPDDQVLSFNDSGGLFVFLVLLFIVCVCACDYNDTNMRGMLNVLWLACVSQSFSSLHNLVGRMTWYFMLPLMILIPNVFENVKFKFKYSRLILESLFCILLIAGGLYYLSSNSMAHAVPYVPFWKD